MRTRETVNRNQIENTIGKLGCHPKYRSFARSTQSRDNSFYSVVFILDPGDSLLVRHSRANKSPANPRISLDSHVIPPSNGLFSLQIKRGLGNLSLITAWTLKFCTAGGQQEPQYFSDFSSRQARVKF